MKTLQSKLYEHAYSAKDYENNLYQQRLNILEHIIKVLIYPNSRDVKKWKSEIVNHWLIPYANDKITNGDKEHVRKERVRLAILEKPYESFRDDKKMVAYVQRTIDMNTELVVHENASDLWHKHKHHMLQIYEKIIDAVAKHETELIKHIIYTEL